MVGQNVVGMKIEATAIDKEAVINTEVAPGPPELFEIRGEVNFVVWEPSL